MENKWKKKSEISIPPLNTEGFQDMVVLRTPVEAKRMEFDEEVTSVLINHEDELTVLLQEDKPYSYVIKRLKTEEEYIVKSFPVSIGKGSMCDFILQGNKAISRKHAQINKKDNHFYIKDLGSANHIYIEDTLIEDEVELCEGMPFRLADEQFVFQLKDEKI